MKTESESRPQCLTIKTEIDERVLAEPFVIARETITHVALTRVTVSDGVHSGRGEGTPKSVYGQSAQSDKAMLDGLELPLSAGPEDIQSVLPAGSARNALDCALWDLRAKQQGKSIWQLLDLPEPETALSGAVTISIGTPEAMAARAAQWKDYPLVKIKLDRHLVAERIAAIRNAAPDTRLMIDVNEGWSFDELQRFAPVLAQHKISLLEQPLPRKQDTVLAGYDCPVPLAADESLHTRQDLARLADLYDWVNIKLDKTGGLTEALALAADAKAQGLELMVGCMVGTSLAMAPGFVVGSLCEVRDLDGASMLVEDETPPLAFHHGYLQSPHKLLWG